MGSVNLEKRVAALEEWVAEAAEQHLHDLDCIELLIAEQVRLAEELESTDRCMGALFQMVDPVEYPEGSLAAGIIKTFEAMEKEASDRKYAEGMERRLSDRRGEGPTKGVDRRRE